MLKQFSILSWVQRVTDLLEGGGYVSGVLLTVMATPRHGSP